MKYIGFDHLMFTSGRDSNKLVSKLKKVLTTENFRKGGYHSLQFYSVLCFEQSNVTKGTLQTPQSLFLINTLLATDRWYVVILKALQTKLYLRKSYYKTKVISFDIHGFSLKILYLPICITCFPLSLWKCAMVSLMVYTLTCPM